MAMFTDTKKSETQTLTAGTLSATFTGNGAISSELTPMSDDEAAKVENNKFTFTLTNTGSLPMNYTITIYSDSVTDGEPLDAKYIKVQYDNEQVTYLSNLSSDNNSHYILKTGEITANDAKNHAETHTIRVWVSDKDADNQETGTDIIDKKIKLSIGLSGTVKEN